MLYIFSLILLKHLRMKSVLAKQNYSNNLTSLSDDFLEQFHVFS